MERNVSIDIALTPMEVEEEVWNMDSDAQVELLKRFVLRYESTKHFPVLMQMQNIYDSMKELCDEDEQESIIRLVSEFLDFLKGDVYSRNKTNGEVIQELFPKIDKGFSNVIDLNLWWNAKYKTESREGAEE